MLGEQVNSIGYIVSEYPDFDDKTKVGVQIIFENGGFDGFSAVEQDLWLKDLGVNPLYTDYVFENVWKVEQDRRNGYWKFE